MIIEDGSGIRDANSYTTVSFFRAYHTARGVPGIDSVTLPDASVEALLVKATDYIDTKWGPYFMGRKMYRALQSRSIFTLTDNPSDGDTVTFGSVTYTFADVPSGNLDVEIAGTSFETLYNLATVFATNENADLAGSAFFGDYTSVLHVFTTGDGVSTTESSANGSFNAATSTGVSSLPQVLEFPRSGLTDRAGNLVRGVPLRLQQATAEYALRAKDGTLAPDLEVDASGMILEGSRQKVGPIETEKTLVRGQLLRPYPAADRLLTEYVHSGGVIRG